VEKRLPIDTKILDLVNYFFNVCELFVKVCGWFRAPIALSGINGQGTDMHW